jgi:hypothetical protein
MAGSKKLDEQLAAVKQGKKGGAVAPPEPPPATPVPPAAPTPMVSDTRKYPYDTLDIWKLRKMARLRKVPMWNVRPRAGLLIAMHAQDEKKKGEKK